MFGLNLKKLNKHNKVYNMLEVINTDVFGLKNALIKSGLPMKVDINIEEDSDTYKTRGKKLGHSPIGSGHDNFLSGVLVTTDVKFSLYWLKQFQRYHFVQIVSSQSTMHRVTKMNIRKSCNEFVDDVIIEHVETLINLYFSII